MRTVPNQTSTRRGPQHGFRGFLTHQRTPRVILVVQPPEVHVISSHSGARSRLRACSAGPHPA